MKKVVTRERNKTYYRILHVPIWVYVFFVLPGNLSYSLYLHGPGETHWIWLGVVGIACLWRGWRGRLPGVEPRPYITHYGEDKPNLPYRVVCYTAAWIAMLVPFVLNFIGLTMAAFTGEWLLESLYRMLYYPLAGLLALGTILDCTPRARRSTRNEGVEKGWFYVALWTVVPAQIVIWAVWRLGGELDLPALLLARIRMACFLLSAGVLFFGCLRGWLPRTERVNAL